MIKYLVFPGWMRSASDGEEHFITGTKLIKLYGADPAECKVIRTEADKNGVDMSRYPHLYPQFDGNYSLPGGAA